MVGHIKPCGDTRQLLAPQASLTLAPKAARHVIPAAPHAHPYKPRENQKHHHKAGATHFEKHFLKVTTHRRTSGFSVTLWVTTVPRLHCYPSGNPEGQQQASGVD